jgi:hypothetical protein
MTANIYPTGLPGLDHAREVLEANGVTVTPNYAQGGWNLVDTVRGGRHDGVGMFEVIDQARTFETTQEANCG